MNLKMTTLLDQFNETLNCDIGNIQCGGKCQNRNNKCPSEKDEEVSRQLDKFEKLITNDCEFAFKCKILCTGVRACESGHVCTHLRMQCDITQSSCPRPTVHHLLRANFGSNCLPSVSLLFLSVFSKHAGIRTC
jgi:hypothetical protein